MRRHLRTFLILSFVAALFGLSELKAQDTVIAGSENLSAEQIFDQYATSPEQIFFREFVRRLSSVADYPDREQIRALLEQLIAEWKLKEPSLALKVEAMRLFGPGSDWGWIDLSGFSAGVIIRMDLKDRLSGDALNFRLDLDREKMAELEVEPEHWRILRTQVVQFHAAGSDWIAKDETRDGHPFLKGYPRKWAIKMPRTRKPAPDQLQRKTDPQKILVAWTGLQVQYSMPAISQRIAFVDSQISDEQANLMFDGDDAAWRGWGTAAAGWLLAGLETVELMPLRKFSNDHDKDKEEKDLEQWLKELRSAIESGAKIIVLDEEVSANQANSKIFIQKLERLMSESPNVLFITSSSGLSGNLDRHPIYPAALKAPNLLTHTVISSSFPRHSGYGKNSVGLGIHQFDRVYELKSKGVYESSVLPPNHINFPNSYMARVATVALSLKPELTATDLVTALYETANPNPKFAGHIHEGRIFDIDAFFGRLEIPQGVELVKSALEIKPSSPKATNNSAQIKALEAACAGRNPSLGERVKNFLGAAFKWL